MMGELEVVAMSVSAEQGAGWADDDGPIEELARRKGVRPIALVDELADADAFETDDELEAFLADMSASRHVNGA
jgi:hypothetical protein